MKRWNRQRWTRGALAIASMTLAAACADDPGPVGVGAEAGLAEANATSFGAVYLMSNAAGPNEVLVFHREADGSLAAGAPVATGGEGTGAGLGNQGAVTLSQDGKWLFVVNAGTDDVSVFRVGRAGDLTLTDRTSSGGDLPISVTVHGNLVYVLNGGAPNSISGLVLGVDGSLEPLPGSTKPLSGAAVGPAQIGFTPDGRALVVTEKGTNMITSFVVGRDGLPSDPISQASAGETPFGFSFDHKGNLIVSEAFGGAADASTVSSYAVARDGSVNLIDGPVALTETAACWIAISQNGRFAYTTNTGSGTVSGLRIGAQGSLSLLDADGETGDTGAGSAPIDADFTQGGRYLYVLAGGASAVRAFEIGADGSLTSIPGIALPAGANGLAAW